LAKGVLVRDRGMATFQNLSFWSKLRVSKYLKEIEDHANAFKYVFAQHSNTRNKRLWSSI